MKSRLFLAVFFGTLAFLLVMAFCVQDAQMRTPRYTSDTTRFIQRDIANTPVRIPSLSFTPAYTVYLPLAMNNFGQLVLHPGQTLSDPEMDVSSAHIDVISLNSELGDSTANVVLSDETLQVTFNLRDIPSEITFNRFGVPQNYTEYKWEVYVDIDNNLETGSDWERYQGTEYALGAAHWAFTPDSPVTKPIQDGVQVNTWEYREDIEDGVFSYLRSANIQVDAEQDTLTLTGDIPGITSESRLIFETFDYNPGGERERDMMSR